MFGFGRRLAALVAAALLLSIFAAAPVAAQAPSWSHKDARVCAATGADQARCTSIARTFYLNGTKFQAKTKSALRAVPTAAQTTWFHGPDLRTAYGITATGDPSKVVAIVDAYDDPNAYTNLTRFRTDQNLPTLPSCDLATLTSLTSSSGSPCFTKVNQTGGTSLPAADSGWSNEIDLDLQAASSICPNCSILLLEATTSSLGNLGTAVTTASNTAHVTAISNSYGISGDYPGSFATAWDNAAKKGIAVTASSGDGGYGVLFPASGTNVLGVGGTTLSTDSVTGVRTSEAAWNGAGSGCSVYNAAPAWVSIPGNPCGTKKAVADLSADADPNSGLAVYTTYSNVTGYWLFGGTSLASPLIATLYAMQGGYGGSTLAGQYAWASTTPYYDVTTGKNGSCGTVLCNAGQGWDGPTGRGSISEVVMAPPVLTTIAVSPANASVQVNAKQQFTATAKDQYGNPMSPQPVFTWSVSGGGTIDPSSGLFTADASASGPNTVTASGGGKSGTANVTVTAVPADFALSVSPTSQSVRRGSTATYAVTITGSGGFSGSVTLSLTGQPSGSTVTFSPNPATGSSTLTITTNGSTTRRTYSLTIKGTSGSLSHTVGASLTVTR